MSASCLPWLILTGMALLALGFWTGRCWADRVTLPAWVPRWLCDLLNWRRRGS